MKVALLGPPGSFSEEAALEYYGPDIEIVYASGFDEMVKLVDEKKVDGYFIPTETSRGGMITEARDAILKSDAKIVGKYDFEPQFYMFAKEDNPNLKSIGSHPQGLIASRDFLDKNYPQLTRIKTSSTSEAARLASEDPTLAAISSKRAGEIYNLQELHKIPIIKFEPKKGSICVYAGNPKSLQEIIPPNGRDLGGGLEKCGETLEKLLEKYRKNSPEGVDFKIIR
ncbi:MAG: prephenate dehydratase domain-containing protein [Candidatus Aenigmatarchaeota archaeon]